MEVREFLVVDKLRRDLTKSDQRCVYGIAIDAKEPSDSFYSEYNSDEQAEILNCIKAHDEITQIILRNDRRRQGLFWRNIKTVEPWDSDTNTCPTCNAIVFFDDEIDHLCEQQRRDILTTSKIAYACPSNHRYCSACDTHAKEDGLRGGCSICASAGKNRKGHRAPRDIYFSNVNPRPLYGIEYNPNDLNCLNCKTKIDFEKSEALVCDQGHRYCLVCACEHSSSANNLCPECMNGPTERLVIGVSTSIKVYFYGASIDLPMIAEKLSSNWCALCFVDLDGAPVVKFRSQWRACGACMASIENKMKDLHFYSSESWSLSLIHI